MNIDKDEKIENTGEKSIYELGLHEEIHIGGDTYVLKVPGGWIYIFVNAREYGTDNIVFVPDERRT